MKLSTLDTLWNTKTGGTVFHIGDGPKQYGVTYSPKGKVYRFYSGSVYALAMRLDCIPEPDMVADARRIVAELVETGHAIGFCASIDTVRYLWRDAETIPVHDGPAVDGECGPLFDTCSYVLLNVADDPWHSGAI